MDSTVEQLVYTYSLDEHLHFSGTFLCGLQNSDDAKEIHKMLTSAPLLLDRSATSFTSKFI